MLLLVLSLFSCRTTKTAIKETSHVTTERHDNVVTTKENHAVTNIDTTFSDQSGENDSTITTIVNELLSAPDSIGKQHAIQRTTTTQKAYHNKKNDVKGGSKTNIDNTNKSNLSKKSGSKSDKTTKAKQQEETKIAMPVWIKGAIALFCLALLVGVYFVLRRFGAITWVVGIFGRLRNKTTIK